MPTKKETYKVFVNCTNCEYEDETQIKKGKKVEEMECPTCGCMTLSKYKSFGV